MKLLISTLLICNLQFLKIAHAQQSFYYNWAKGINIQYFGNNNSIATDPLGNTLIFGTFNGIVDFDPSQDSALLSTTAVNYDLFLAKYDAFGNYVYAIQIGGVDNERGNGLAIDHDGNVYITGIFYDTVDFDPGPNSFFLISAGVNDAFVAKYDTYGNLVYAKNIGGISSELSEAITVDDAGNAYIIGRFDSHTDFDPGPGVFQINGSLGSFFAKYDAYGNFLFVKAMIGNFFPDGKEIALDASGNIYLAGNFNNSADFDPGPGTAFLYGYFNMFFAKYDPNGNFIFAKGVGGSDLDYLHGLAVDDDNNIYITGDFKGTADFNPSSGVSNLVSAGWVDSFFAKYDENGNYVYANRIGSNSLDEGRGIAVDADRNVYISGNFSNTIDFDLDTGTANLTSTASGYRSTYLAIYDSIGNYIKANVLGNTTGSQNYSMCLDANKSVYLLGGFGGSLDFDLGPDSAILNFSNSAFYLLKYNSDTVDAVDFLVSSNNICAGENVFFSNLSTIIDSTASYLWDFGNGATPANSNSQIPPMVTYSVAGLVNVSLTVTDTSSITTVKNNYIHVNPLSYATDYQTSCDAYTWIDGNTYIASTNSQTFVLTNANGCDSIVTLDLTINLADVSISLLEPVISANAISADYQWLDCNNNNSPINNETNQTFTALVNGNYAVEVTQNGCKDTSACVIVIVTLQDYVDIKEDLKLFPNPTNGNLIIEKEAIELQKIIIKNVIGEIFIEHDVDLKNNKLMLDLSHLAKGIYILEAHNRDKRYIQKVIKE